MTVYCIGISNIRHIIPATSEISANIGNILTKFIVSILYWVPQNSINHICNMYQYQLVYETLVIMQKRYLPDRSQPSINNYRHFPLYATWGNIIPAPHLK